MSNHEACPECCCVLKICCPPGSARQRQSLSGLIQRKLNSRVPISPEQANAVAELLTGLFDFAPAGTLDPLTKAVAAMAREKPSDG